MRQGKKLKNYKMKAEYEFAYEYKRKIETHNLRPDIVEAKKNFLTEFKSQLTGGKK